MRVYNAEPPEEAVAALGRIPRCVLACIYTRHHDGYVRQRHLQQIVDLDHRRVIRFVVQLIGEYVVEIALASRAALGDLDVQGSDQRARYGRFIADNPAFLELTGQRLISCWDCYYRTQYPAREDYPGSLLVASLGNTASEHR